MVAGNFLILWNLNIISLGLGRVDGGSVGGPWGGSWLEVTAARASGSSSCSSSSRQLFLCHTFVRLRCSHGLRSFFWMAIKTKEVNALDEIIEEKLIRVRNLGIENQHRKLTLVTRSKVAFKD